MQCVVLVCESHYLQRTSWHGIFSIVLLHSVWSQSSYRLAIVSLALHNFIALHQAFHTLIVLAISAQHYNVCNLASLDECFRLWHKSLRTQVFYRYSIVKWAVLICLSPPRDQRLVANLTASDKVNSTHDYDSCLWKFVSIILLHIPYSVMKTVT